MRQVRDHLLFDEVHVFRLVRRLPPPKVAHLLWLGPDHLRSGRGHPRRRRTGAHERTAWRLLAGRPNRRYGAQRGSSRWRKGRQGAGRANLRPTGRMRTEARRRGWVRRRAPPSLVRHGDKSPVGPPAEGLGTGPPDHARVTRTTSNDRVPDFYPHTTFKHSQTETGNRLRPMSAAELWCFGGVVSDGPSPLSTPTPPQANCVHAC